MAGRLLIVNYSGSEDHAKETVAAIHRQRGTASAVQANVSNVADIDRLFATAVEHFTQLDIVVAKAGVELTGQPVLEFTEADFDHLFSVNTKGAFFTLQRAAKYVADNSRIIYLGSSTTTFPMRGRYAGNKIAPQLLIEVLAKENGASRSIPSYQPPSRVPECSQRRFDRRFVSLSDHFIRFNGWEPRRM